MAAKRRRTPPARPPEANDAPTPPAAPLPYYSFLDAVAAGDMVTARVLYDHEHRTPEWVMSFLDAEMAQYADMQTFVPTNPFEAKGKEAALAVLPARILGLKRWLVENA
jgi:hypothetical protein